jgi:hypothetical protein
MKTLTSLGMRDPWCLLTNNHNADFYVYERRHRSRRDSGMFWLHERIIGMAQTISGTPPDIFLGYHAIVGTCNLIRMFCNVYPGTSVE